MKALWALLAALLLAGALPLADALALPGLVSVAAQGRVIRARATGTVTWELLGPGGTLYPLFYGNRGDTLLVPLGVDWPGGTYTVVAVSPLGAARVRLTVPSSRGMGPRGVTPLALALHYRLTALYAQGLLGAGVGVGVYTPTAPSLGDLALFDRIFGLPPAHVSFAGCDPFARGGEGAQAEADIDLEWVHAVAPAARLDVYCPYGGAPPDVAAVGAAPAEAALFGDAVFSISMEWTGITYGEVLRAREADPFLLMPLPLSHPISVFVASGDEGRVVDAWPQDDPHVVAVGGTMWVGGEEVYWRDGPAGGGYGISTWPRPSWQTLPSRWRRTPDVSVDASDYEGVAGGQISLSEGTSFSAPVWAGIWALVAQDYRERSGRSIGWANPALYRLAEGPYGSLAFPDTGAARGPARFRPRLGWGPPDAAALDFLVARGELGPGPLFQAGDLAALTAGHLGGAVEP